MTVEQIDKSLRDRGLRDELDPVALAAVRGSYPEFLGNESELGENEIPMLVVIGEQDRPPRAQKLAEITSNAEFKIVPGDHMAAPATPEYMEALLEFLSKHEPDRQ